MRFVRTAENLFSLPLGFTRLEYLQSTGTQYIDTGYKLSTGTTHTFSGNIMWTQSNGIANFFYGYRSVNSAEYRGDMRAFFVYGPSGGGSTGRLAIRYGVNTDNSTSTINTNQKYNISFDGTNLKVDGATFINLSAAYTPANYKNMYLFWCNCTGYYSADVAKFSGRIYNWKIFEDGVAVRDFVPCLDPLGVPCMYDLVGKKPYYNQGTGTFTVGRQVIPVEYLESSGTQYIKTGYIPNINTECSMNLAFVSLDSTYRTPFSVRTADGATNSFTIMSVRATNDNNSFAFGSNYWSGSSVPSVVLNKTVKAVLRKGYASWDGVSGNPGNSITPTTLTAYMFARNANGTAANFFKGRIYDCQLKENNTLVRYYIPCKDENNVGFMFDTLSGTVYLNAGTGDFSVGENKYTSKLRLIKDTDEKVRFIQDVLPREYRPLKYLQSTGTQYIDTGVYPTQLTEAEYRCAVTGSVANNDSHLFGSRLSASSEAFDLAYMNTTPNGIEKFRFIHGTTTTQETTTSVTASQIANPHTYYMSGTSFKVDGSEKMSFTTSSFTGSYSLWLFGVNNAGSLHSQVRAQRVYKCTIWDNGVPVRDLYPALRKSDNKVGMYDRITKQFFVNQGTGEFNYG